MDPDHTTHEFHQLPTDREAKSSATKATSGGIVGLLEWYEQEFDIA